MGWKIGLPSLKLNNAGVKSNSCGDFRSVAEEALEERKGHDPDIDPEKSALNKYEGFKTAAELREYSRKHVAELSEVQKAAGKRGIRKDAVVMCATVLKPPAAMMNQLSIADQGRFMDDAFEIFKGIIGEENIKSRADHYDEQGLHTHVFWEPMTEDGRLCAKEMHNIKFFGRLNREMPAKLREKGWDIDDCRMYDAAMEDHQREREKKAAGRSSYEFKAQAERDKRELEAKVEELQKQVTEANTRAEVAEAEVADLREEVHGLKFERMVLQGDIYALKQEKEEIQEWMEQIPDWPSYETEALRAFKLLDDFRKLLKEFFDRLWLWRDRKGERHILDALGVTRDKIMTSISMMAGYEAREKVAPELQRSRVIGKSLDEMMKDASEKVLPQKKLPEKSKEIEI